MLENHKSDYAKFVLNTFLICSFKRQAQVFISWRPSPYLSSSDTCLFFSNPWYWQNDLIVPNHRIFTGMKLSAYPKCLVLIPTMNHISLTACHLMFFWLDFLLCSIPFIMITTLNIINLWANEEKGPLPQNCLSSLSSLFSDVLCKIFHRIQRLLTKISLWLCVWWASLMLVSLWTSVFIVRLIEWLSHNRCINNVGLKIIVLNVCVL